MVFINIMAQDYDLDKRKLTESELNTKCDRVLSIMRNEIYARHGYRFSNEAIQDYFEYKGWYRPVADNKEVKLNQIEQNNVNLIKSVENKRQSKYKAISLYFGQLKKAFENKDNNYIKNIFSKMTENYERESMELLSTVMSKIDPSDINYYKNKGTNKTEVDNGYVVMEYSIYVEDDMIQLTYNYQRHSDIIEGFDSCTTYMSEEEFAYMWRFKIDQNNKISFDVLVVAG